MLYLTTVNTNNYYEVLAQLRSFLADSQVLSLTEAKEIIENYWEGKSLDEELYVIDACGKNDDSHLDLISDIIAEFNYCNKTIFLLTDELNYGKYINLFDQHKTVKELFEIFDEQMLDLF